MKRKAVWIISLTFIGLAIGLALFVTRSDKEGLTPLMKAAYHGDIAEVGQAISDGVDLNQRSAYGWSALIFAAMQGHEDVVRQLVEAGADVDIKSGEVPARFSTTGNYPATSALFEAISKRHYSVAHYLLDQNALVDTSVVAVSGSSGDLELLSRILELGAPINAVSDNQYFRTPLSAAARHGNIENLNWLLEHGADPNLPLPHTSNLNEAVRGLQPEATKALLEAGAEVDAFIGTRNSTALREIVTTHAGRRLEEKIEIVQLLLLHGADPTYRPDEHSRSAIEFVENSIEEGLKQSNNPDFDQETKERILRSLEADRTILGHLEAHKE
jgi:Ankyrin repeats (3 copies)